MPNEADTCGRFVAPKLQKARWDKEPHRINEQVTYSEHTAKKVRKVLGREQAR